MCKPLDYRNYVEKLKGYFAQAIDRLTETKVTVAVNSDYLKGLIFDIESSEGVLSLYEELKSMTE